MDARSSACSTSRPPASTSTPTASSPRTSACSTPRARVIRARDWLADPGVEIPEGATAIHGITTAHARAEGRPAAEVVAEVVAALRALLDAGIPVVAYNAPYDFSLLKYEALRHGIEPIVDPSPVIDPLVVDKAYDR